MDSDHADQEERLPPRYNREEAGKQAAEAESSRRRRRDDETSSEASRGMPQRDVHARAYIQRLERRLDNKDTLIDAIREELLELRAAVRARPAVEVSNTRTPIEDGGRAPKRRARSPMPPSEAGGGSRRRATPSEAASSFPASQYTLPKTKDKTASHATELRRRPDLEEPHRDRHSGRRHHHGSRDHSLATGVHSRHHHEKGHSAATEERSRHHHDRAHSAASKPPRQPEPARDERRLASVEIGRAHV